MDDQILHGGYDRLQTLMDDAAQAITRKDVLAIRSVEGAMARWNVEMEAFVVPLDSSRESVASLKQAIQEALERMRSNETRLADWLHETGAKLARLQQGAAAVRDYAPGIINPPILERRV